MFMTCFTAEKQAEVCLFLPFILLILQGIVLISVLHLTMFGSFLFPFLLFRVVVSQAL